MLIGGAVTKQLGFRTRIVFGIWRLIVCCCSAGLSDALDDRLQQRLWRAAGGKDSAKSIRVLCLHGYTQNGSVFKKKLSGLERAVIAQLPGATFVFPTGPHEADASWVTKLDDADRAAADAAGVSGCRAWWVHNEKDENATDFTGWSQSEQLLSDTRCGGVCLAKLNVESFDIIILPFSFTAVPGLDHLMSCSGFRKVQQWLPFWQHHGMCPFASPWVAIYLRTIQVHQCCLAGTVNHAAYTSLGRPIP
eukprot:SAG31_NODE_99_length_25388_cov_12.710507_21_plen_249_part_00